MSRGPGCIERAIETAFRAEPSRTFSTAELTAIAYPSIDKPEKRHRVATLRSAYKVAKREHWCSWRTGADSIFANFYDAHGHTLGMFLASWYFRDKPLAERRALLEDSFKPGGRYDGYIAATEAWIEHHKALAAGDTERLHELWLKSVIAKSAAEAASREWDHQHYLWDHQHYLKSRCS